MKVTLLWHTPHPQQEIARAAGMTRGRPEVEEGANVSEYIRRLIERGHDSVLEFASAAFLIERISRACLAQLTRHRLSSFAVLSHRHVPAAPEFVTPPSIAADPELKERFDEAASRCFSLYRELIDRGVRKEDARYVLPQALATSLIMAANFRQWRRILRLRLDPSAQWEIRELCGLILDELLKIAPAVFEDLREA